MDAALNAGEPGPVDAIDDGADFVRKWRGAWPEWDIAEIFVPPAERGVAPWWQALQFELMEAAWGGPDARPGDAKLGWWVEELAGWEQGRRRHPLGRVLTKRPAPWSTLAHALPLLAASRARPTSASAAWEQLMPVAGAVASVEAALLGAEVDARVTAACWLHGRLARHPGGAVPLDLDDASAWARCLTAGWPRRRGLAPTRRIESALARARLAAGDAAQPRGPLATVWACWRGARD